MDTVLEMHDICKSYYGEDGIEIHANDHVNFDLKKGEIHGLLGENGAGKSTLVMNLCREPDHGTIMINGESVQLDTPKDAFEHGIGIFYYLDKSTPCMKSKRIRNFLKLNEELIKWWCHACNNVHNIGTLGQRQSV